MTTFSLQQTAITPGFLQPNPYQFFSAEQFPTIHPVHWLHSHFAVGGWSPLQRISGMLTAHMTQIAPQNGFTWHPHRGLEIYTWVIEGELYHEDTTGGRGMIRAGELQRMFAGDYIEHQELNLSDQPTRVIQIWYIADRKHQGLEPHYQQVSKSQLPQQRIGNATEFNLIGTDSPMEQHMIGRLTATSVDPGGSTQLQPPHPGEDVFVYFTDGAGQATWENKSDSIKQYDVMLATPDVGDVAIQADDDQPLHFLSFYLPRFITN